MLVVSLLTTASAFNPSEVEAWLPELTHAVEVGDTVWLEGVFSELLSRGVVDVDELRAQLRQEMQGTRDVECRGAICRVRWVREKDRSSLLVHQVNGEWQHWDPAFGGHIDGPVEAIVSARGTGEVELRINGTPTFLFETVDGRTDRSTLDRQLTPGLNLLTLVPRGEVSASLRVAGKRGELVTFDGDLGSPRTFTFRVAEGTRPTPR